MSASPAHLQLVPRWPRRDPSERRMNPATLMRLWNGLGRQSVEPVHLITICANAGEKPTWPGTVYTAVALGYLTRAGAQGSAVYLPTRALLAEVDRVTRLRSG